MQVSRIPKTTSHFVNINNQHSSNPQQSLIKANFKQILSYNIHGLNTLINLPSEYLEIILDCEVIILTESWATSEEDYRMQQLMNLVPTFEVHLNPAKKSERGRSSGGIIVMLKKKEFKILNVIEQTQWYTTVEIEGRNSRQKVIIIAVYLNDSFQKREMEAFKVHIDNIQLVYPAELIICTGDFNARIGLLDQFEADILPNARWSDERKSRDKATNERGKKIHAFFETSGFLVLNGRSRSDEDGDLTFLSKSIQSETKLCGSVIDLCFVNLACIDQVHDFQVLETSGSDHFPIKITLGDLRTSSKFTLKKKLKWNPNLEELYQEKVNLSLQGSPEQDRPLSHIINQVAQELKLVSRGIPMG